MDKEQEKSKELSELTTCQECGSEDPNLTNVESGLKLTLSKSGRTDIPNYVCSSCLKTLRKSATHGAQQLAKQEMEVSHTTNLWKHRTQMVKQGHIMLQRGDYVDAAICYEKYLKVLCLVSKKDHRKDLDPKLFNDHPKEVTIICSVLWDLMLIYDANIKFAQKQLETAEILSRFLRFSPIYNNIIRKTEREVPKAKNPQAFKHLLKLCDVHAGRCFIANETFGSRIDPTVVLLCDFRDQRLRSSFLGRKFIALYYKKSPGLAQKIRQFPATKWLLRPLLWCFARLLKPLSSK